jgi:hypothetical protein
MGQQHAAGGRVAGLGIEQPGQVIGIQALGALADQGGVLADDAVQSSSRVSANWGAGTWCGQIQKVREQSTGTERRHPVGTRSAGPTVRRYWSYENIQFSTNQQASQMTGHSASRAPGRGRALYEEFRARIADGTYGGAPLLDTRAAAERGLARHREPGLRAVGGRRLSADARGRSQPGRGPRPGTCGTAALRRRRARHGPTAAGRLSAIGQRIAA